MLLSGLCKFLIVLCSFHLTSAIRQYEGNGLRGGRPRPGSKRPSAVYSIEHNSGDNNQWKPILDLPANHLVPSGKYRKPKPHVKSSPNFIFTTEYYPKRIHQSASTNFIANQSLLVASDYIPQQVKTHSSKTKLKHHHQQQQQQQQQQLMYIPTHAGSHYEVHEQVNEEAAAYEGRIPEPVTSKPVTEKHLHHVHYHKGTVLNEGPRFARPTVRNVRFSVRRP